MSRQTTFPRNEDSDQSLSDEDIDDALDQLTYNNDCTEKLHSLYPHERKTLSRFSDYYQSEVHESCRNTGPVQSQLKEEHLSDSFDESISDEDNLVATESSLAYQCGTSGLGENYNGSKKIEGSNTLQWNEILEDSSLLYFQPKKPISTEDKAKAKLKFSIRSNLNLGGLLQESKIKKESTDEEEQVKSENEEVQFLEDITEEDDIVPYETIPYEQKGGPRPSMTELLAGLQGNNCNPSLFNSSVLAQKAREERKRILPKLGERTLENEDDPPDIIAGDTSSDEEEINQELSLLPQQIDGQPQTMADLFQEACNASKDMVSALPTTNASGSNYKARLAQVMQLEEKRHPEFSRFSHALHSSSSKIVQIMSRSLEGHLTVCRCLFQPPSDEKLFERFTDGEKEKERMIIFNSKKCENADLVVGNLIRIYPPWKEVLVKEESIILCTYFSNDVA